jgi:hypothetical protein
MFAVLSAMKAALVEAGEDELRDDARRSSADVTELYDSVDAVTAAYRWREHEPATGRSRGLLREGLSVP